MSESIIPEVSPSRFSRMATASKRYSKTTGNVLKNASIEVLHVSEATVLTVGEPLKAVGVTTGRTFSDKYDAIALMSEVRKAVRAQKRAAKAAARVAEAERILAEARTADVAVVEAPAPAPKPRTSRSKTTLTTVPSS